MFDGCGEDLTKDELTGEKGNYSYLASANGEIQNGSFVVLENSYWFDVTVMRGLLRDGFCKTL